MTRINYLNASNSIEISRDMDHLKPASCNEDDDKIWPNLSKLQQYCETLMGHVYAVVKSE